MVYDTFMAEFRQIVMLADIILKHRCVEKFFGGGAFSFDSECCFFLPSLPSFRFQTKRKSKLTLTSVGLIYPLMTPAMSCRDLTLRRKAISLLCIRPWREAQWHSYTSADIARFLMEVEEEGVETDHIPEWARARLSGVIADQEKRSLHLHCIRGVGENTTQRDSLRYYFVGEG